MLVLRTHFFVNVNKKLLWVRRGVFTIGLGRAQSRIFVSLRRLLLLIGRELELALLKCPRSSRAARTPPWWQWAAKLQRFSDVTKPVLCFFSETYIFTVFCFCTLIEKLKQSNYEEVKVFEIKKFHVQYKASLLSNQKSWHDHEEGREIKTNT